MNHYEPCCTSKTMLKIFLTFLFCFLVFPGNIISADQNITYFDALVEYSKLDSISDSILMKSEKLVDQILKSKESSPQGSVTYYFGLICLKSSSDKGVSSYVEYLISQEDSPEEELSFRFEPIFFKHPETVLSVIKKAHPSHQPTLLDHIVWGFLNNTESVTKDNYKDMFFAKNPEVKKLYVEYRTEIDRIFQGIDQYFNWLENHKNKN